jgi:hypothetical protein
MYKIFPKQKNNNLFSFNSQPSIRPDNHVIVPQMPDKRVLTLSNKVVLTTGALLLSAIIIGTSPLSN